MKRTVVIASLAVAVLVIAFVAGCSAPAANETPGTGAGNPAAGGGTGELRLAPGLYDLEDGTVNAVGTLEWKDLEGGFWAVIGGTEGSGDVGKVVAVLANAGKDDPAYTSIAGKQVFVTGKRLEGASVRMAGPEIEVTKIEAFSDTPGIAE